jgi:hypothetical protein
MQRADVLCIETVEVTHGLSAPQYRRISQRKLPDVLHDE